MSECRSSSDCAEACRSQEVQGGNAQLISPSDSIGMEEMFRSNHVSRDATERGRARLPSAMRGIQHCYTEDGQRTCRQKGRQNEFRRPRNPKGVERIRPKCRLYGVRPVGYHHSGARQSHDSTQTVCEIFDATQECSSHPYPIFVSRKSCH